MGRQGAGGEPARRRSTHPPWDAIRSYACLCYLCAVLDWRFPLSARYSASDAATRRPVTPTSMLSRPGEAGSCASRSLTPRRLPTCSAFRAHRSMSLRAPWRTAVREDRPAPEFCPQRPRASHRRAPYRPLVPGRLAVRHSPPNALSPLIAFTASAISASLPGWRAPVLQTRLFPGSYPEAAARDGRSS